MDVADRAVEGPMAHGPGDEPTFEPERLADRREAPEPTQAAEGAAGGSGSGPASGDNSALRFPDLPRLELDQLLAQLVDRAHEVLRTQDRLRGLVRAHQLIT